MSKKFNRGIEEYLAQVDRYLKPLSVSEKTDILSELKSSFSERMNHGQSEESIVAEMEPAKVLAMKYFGESIVENPGFSFRQFMKVLGFYSLASVAWISVIPTLAILAVAFFLSSGLSVLAGVMAMLKGMVHLSLIDDVRMMLFVHEITGVPALCIGLAFAILFVGLGAACWKGTVGMVQRLQEKSWALKHPMGKKVNVAGKQG